MPTSSRISKCSLVASCAFLVVFGGVALVSRCRFSAMINAGFQSGVGAEYQSWFEHFLSGFAAPSLLFISLLPLWSVLTSKREGNPNAWCIRRAKEWLSPQSELRLYIIFLSTIMLLYIVISANWEFGQFMERGTFQWGQFSCDAVGSLIWFLVLKHLSPNPLFQWPLRLSAANP